MRDDDDLPRERSWYVNCPCCRADYHVVGHNRKAGDDRGPEFCAFCGRSKVDVTPEPGRADR